MAKDKEITRGGWHHATGLMLLAVAVLAFLSVVSYDWADISLFACPPHQPPGNFIGPVGAWFSCIMFMTFGVVGYLVPLALGVLGACMTLKHTGRTWPKVFWLLLILFGLVCVAEMTTPWWQGLAAFLNIGNVGGILGALVVQLLLIHFLGSVGTGILAALFIVGGLALLVEMHPLRMFKKMFELPLGYLRQRRAERQQAHDRQAEIEHEERDLERRRRELEKAIAAQEEARARAAAKPAPPPPPPPEPPPPTRLEKKLAEGEKKKPKPAPPPPPEPPPPIPGALAWKLPPISLLGELPPENMRQIQSDFTAGTKILEETLAEFGIDAKVTNVETGPVVTSYEVLPAPGIRVERIAALSNNLALTMKAVSVRVQAPIPGKGVVGIEVPNVKSTTVYLREILESEAWQHGKAALPMALGKDVGGREIVTDLAKMPHLLIAGATGSGKSVCMNSLLAGMLMMRTPDQLRLMLVDPKMVEFSFFNNLPHLVVPVITDAKKVGLGLRWAINEMEKRYKLFARVGVRNIQSYNERPLVKQAELALGPDVPPPAADDPPARLPYLVIVIDELADLMMVEQAEIESCIARLAQLSRAVGIHMIIATQRPSVNVITGTIKANFPCRISFQVAQKVDSRTILDTIGADKLLGKGDMLFMPPGVGKLARAQGTMTTDQEIRDIAEFWKAQGTPQYEVAIKEKIETKASEASEGEEEDEELIAQAVEVIRQTRRASTSSIQRRLRIGYNRAARLMDVLEERGVVGPPKGADPRDILIDLDGEIPANSADDAPPEPPPEPEAK